MIKISVAAHFQAENLKEQDQRCKPLLTINDDLSTGKCVCHIWRLAIFQNDRPKKIMPLRIRHIFHVRKKSFPLFFLPDISALVKRHLNQSGPIKYIVNTDFSGFHLSLLVFNTTFYLFLNSARSEIFPNRTRRAAKLPSERLK